VVADIVARPWGENVRVCATTGVGRTNLAELWPGSFDHRFSDVPTDKFKRIAAKFVERSVSVEFVGDIQVRIKRPGIHVIAEAPGFGLLAAETVKSMKDAEAVAKALRENDVFAGSAIRIISARGDSA